MGFRTVVIKNRAKLEVRLNSLIIRGEQEKKVFIDEINTLIVQSTAVSLTVSLLCELVKRNIKVIFCDEKLVKIYEHCRLEQVGVFLIESEKKKDLCYLAKRR